MDSPGSLLFIMYFPLSSQRLRLHVCIPFLLLFDNRRNPSGHNRYKRRQRLMTHADIARITHHFQRIVAGAELNSLPCESAHRLDFVSFRICTDALTVCNQDNIDRIAADILDQIRNIAERNFPAIGLIHMKQNFHFLHSILLETVLGYYTKAVWAPRSGAILLVFTALLW